MFERGGKSVRVERVGGEGVRGERL